jgi:hypothetical protein
MVHQGKRQVTRSTLRQDKGHRTEWEVLSAAILAGGPAPIPYNQLLGVTEATFATMEALRTRKSITIEPILPMV